MPNQSSNYQGPASGLQTPSKQVGNVRWFNPKKGFGFIVGPEGRDVFFHHSEIKMEGFRSLNPNQRVEYTLIENKGRFKALEVQPLKS